LAGNLARMTSLNAMSCIISPRKSLPMASRNFSNLVLLTFMGNEAVKQGSLQLQRTSGQPGGRRPGFTARCHCIRAHRGWGVTVHALRSHMSALNFRTKPSIPNFAQDLSDDAFVWASQNI
jgi:hypothetical protein